MPEISIPAGLKTKRCLLGSAILGEVGHALKEYWPKRKIILVADENTWAAAGQEIYRQLQDGSHQLAEPIIFPANPILKAEYRYVRQLLPHFSDCLPVAIGAGTINDLVKRSAEEAKTDGYLCVATAASVDGYTSAGAALTVEGFKQTLPCAAPRVILADSEVLAKAPSEMAAGGYADLAAKVVAGADWLLADQLGCDPLENTAWEMVQKNLRCWLSDPEGLARGENTALEALFTGLAYTGFSMQYYLKSSRPASGAEHLISHTWEMRGLNNQGRDISHGFKVALGTLIVTALYEQTFALSRAELAAIMEQQAPLSPSERQKEVDGALGGTPFYQNAREIALAKLLPLDELRERQRSILQSWPELQAKIAAQLMPFAELKRRFQIVQCPTEPLEIGLSQSALLEGIQAAGMIRNRYSILDLLLETGLRERILPAVLAGGYFRHYRSERII